MNTVTAMNFNNVLNAFPLGKNTEHPSEKKINIHLSGERYVIGDDSIWNPIRAQRHIDNLIQDGISGNIMETFKYEFKDNANIVWFQMKVKGIEYNYILSLTFDTVTNSFVDNISISIIKDHEEMYATINHNEPDNLTLVNSQLLFDVDLPTSEYNIQFEY